MLCKTKKKQSLSTTTLQAIQRTAKASSYSQLEMPLHILHYFSSSLVWRSIQQPTPVFNATAPGS